MKTILVTGTAGYIGSVLTRQCLARGYQVVGFDNLSMGGESLLAFYGHPAFHFVHGDVRNLEDLERCPKFDAAVHLAAIVGDPACAKEPELARSVNGDGARLFHQFCEKRGAKRFVFASTCSNYGKMSGTGYVSETSPLNPVSLYATTKVEFEKYLEQHSSKMVSTVLRFATVYGLSPRMRFDLTVNDFTRQSVTHGELTVFGEQFWRPYCHVEDLAGACIVTLEASEKIVSGQVFGVGHTEENYQKGMIVDAILKQLPQTKINRVNSNQDPRDYRVDFSKIQKVLGFKITRRVADGIREIQDLLVNQVLKNPFAAQYGNV